MSSPTRAALITVRLLALVLLLQWGAEAWRIRERFFYGPTDLDHGRPSIMYPVFERSLQACYVAPLLLLIILSRPVAARLTSGTLPGSATRVLTMILRTAVLFLGTVVLSFLGCAGLWEIMRVLVERGYYTPSGSFMFGVNVPNSAIVGVVLTLVWWSAPSLSDLATRVGRRLQPSRWSAPRPC